MRVTFNSTRADLLAHIGRNSASQARLQSQISSGQKISQADEDPLLAGKILSLQSANSQVQQFYRNAGAALDISRASYSAVDAVRQTSDRAGELASGVSGLTSSSEFSANAKEVNSLVEQALSSANQQFDGKYLLGGSNTDTPPFSVTRDASGNISSVAYIGGTKGPAIQISETSKTSPYPTGVDNGQIGDFINHLVALRDALTSGDSAAVSAQRPALQTSEDNVLGTLGTLGAQQRRLQSAQDAASSRYDSGSASISLYNDVDLSKAIVDLTKSETAYQASLMAAAKITSRSLLDYL